MVWMNADRVQQTRTLLMETLTRCSSRDLSSLNPGSVFASVESAISDESGLYSAGEQALFRGRLKDAVGFFLAAWERARQTSHHELRWRSCLGAARCYFAMQQPALGRHFLQRGRTAFYSVVDEHPAGRLPGEILFSVLKEQSLSAPSESSLRETILPQLLMLRNQTESADFRGWVEELLAQIDFPERQKHWLRDSLNSYLLAGNIYAAMLVAEPLAICSLREGEWAVGTEVIEQAGELAEVLHETACRRHYQRLSSRLKHAMSGLPRTVVYSASSGLLSDCFRLWN